MCSYNFYIALPTQKNFLSLLSFHLVLHVVSTSYSSIPKFRLFVVIKVSTYFGMPTEIPSWSLEGKVAVVTGSGKFGSLLRLETIS